jgi:hypothetical protein
MTELATIELGPSTVILRRAEASDVPALVDLLAADQLGATRDGVTSAEDLAAYQRAFRAIDADPAHLLLVAQAGPRIAGTLHHRVHLEADQVGPAFGPGVEQRRVAGLHELEAAVHALGHHPAADVHQPVGQHPGRGR